MSEWAAQGTGTHPPRKPHARELFAPLGSTYDRGATLLSFGQDPRWRRGDRGGDRRARRASACSTWRPGRGWSRRRSCAATAHASWGSTRARRCSPARGRGWRATRRSRRACRSWKARPSGCRSPTREFDHLTFTYLLRYVEDPAATLRELARVVRPGGPRRDARVRRAAARAVARAVGRTRAWACRCWGALFSREWAEVGRFLARSIPDFYERYPLERVAGLWREAGIGGVADAAHEPRRGRGDVGHA